MPYSAVTQPAPLPRRKGGTDSSTEAVHKTRVSPMAIKTEPSAYLFTPVLMATGRNSSLRRPSTRMVVPPSGVVLRSRPSCRLTLACPALVRKGASVPRLSRLVDRAQRAVLDSPPPRKQETGASTRTTGRHTVASHPLIERARQQGRTLLTELESKQLLHNLGIRTTPGQQQH